MRNKKQPDNLLYGGDLKLEEFNGMDREKTLFILPVGSLEVHGYHLPNCTDMEICKLMANSSGKLFAEKYPDWNVVIMPLLNIGSDELPLPGSIEFSRKTVYRALVEYAKSLSRWGFKNLVITNAHGGMKHNLAIDDACRKCFRKYKMRMISPCIRVFQDFISGKRFSEMEKASGIKLNKNQQERLTDLEHAGGWETSIMMAEHPQKVAGNYRKYAASNVQLSEKIKKRAASAEKLINRIGPVRKLLEKSGITLSEGLRLLKIKGKLYNKTEWFTYCGDPSVSSAKTGKAWDMAFSEELLSIYKKIFIDKSEKPVNLLSRFSELFILRRDFLIVTGWIALAALIVFSVLLTR